MNKFFVLYTLTILLLFCCLAIAKNFGYLRSASEAQSSKAPQETPKKEEFVFNILREEAESV
jgi:hypothetical protein